MNNDNNDDSPKSNVNILELYKVMCSVFTHLSHTKFRKCQIESILDKQIKTVNYKSEYSKFLKDINKHKKHKKNKILTNFVEI